jgi:hypothetical protein
VGGVLLAVGAIVASFLVPRRGPVLVGVGAAVDNVDSLGAYFLASLTVGVTRGPFGLELAHGALVVAFVQLLTALGAAGAAAVIAASKRAGETEPKRQEPDHTCPLRGR